MKTLRTGAFFGKCASFVNRLIRPSCWLVVAMLVGSYPAAHANLEPLSSFSGKFAISVDGGGSTNGSYAIDVLKPNNSATVHKAYLIVAAVYSDTLVSGSIQLNGNPITYDAVYDSGPWHNGYADVTSIVKPVVDAATATTDATVQSVTVPFNIVENESISDIDGTVLVVIFSDPSMVGVQTIVLMFGSQNTSGDTFSITTAETIPSTGVADMGLGISFGFQPTGQYSIIDVNGQRLTTSAGGQDDQDANSDNANSALITVGGLGDSNANPPDPFATGNISIRYDDELYSLLPFIAAASATEVGPRAGTSIQVDTSNPSNDDNIFFAYFVLSGAAVIGEGIILSPSEAINPVGTTHTLTATVVDSEGDPIVDRDVIFKVISGPNEGQESEPLATDSNGQVQWTYTDLAGQEGTDEIEASFINSNEERQYSNVVTKTWTGTLIETTQTLELEAGWNLIYLYVNPYETVPEEVFGPGTYAFTLQKSGSGFNRRYTYNLVTALVGGQAYWIYVPALTASAASVVQIDGTLNTNSTVLLTQAWNMMGAAENRLVPISPIILSTWLWDATTQRYARPPVDPETRRQILQVGVGHFMFVTEPVELVIRSETGIAAGSVRDGFTGEPLVGVTLTFFNGTPPPDETPTVSSAIGTATTNANGQFSIALPPGNVYAEVALDGYVPTVLYGKVVGGQTTQFDTVLAAQDAEGDGDATGEVLDALTGDPVPNATIDVRAGVNTTSGPIVGTFQADEFGGYTVTLPSGSYTAEANAAGFLPGFANIVVVGGQVIPDQNIVITPEIEGDDIRIVLTWGVEPDDLDSHLTGPLEEGGRFHVYYSEEGDTEASPWAGLDVDDTDSFGPETITITRTFDGVYRYSVHDYSNSEENPSDALANSGAQVRVYIGAEEVARFNVPGDQAGTLWTVFEMNGTTRAITPVNTMTYEDDSAAITSGNDAGLLRNLPAK